MESRMWRVAGSAPIAGDLPSSLVTTIRFCLGQFDAAFIDRAASTRCFHTTPFMSKPTVAIIGASQNRHKFGNKSLRAHLKAGYVVYPVNPRAETVEGIRSYASVSEVPQPLSRISLYLPIVQGLALIDEIAAAAPAELWLNPGTDGDELIERAEHLGLRVRVGCSIVDLGLSPAQFPD